MSRQLDAWKGAFGDAYTDRNQPDPTVRERAWGVMLRGLALQTVLEVGSNTGANLRALERINPSWRLTGIEPNAHARQQAMVLTLNGSVTSIPFKDGNFDLVFTCGVLIHVPPEELEAALHELYRVSRRYLLAIEYHADEATGILYRGQLDMLWKRNYLQEYLTRFPDLVLCHAGFWTAKDGFDRCTWHLMEKR